MWNMPLTSIHKLLSFATANHKSQLTKGTKASWIAISSLDHIQRSVKHPQANQKKGGTDIYTNSVLSCKSPNLRNLETALAQLEKANSRLSPGKKSEPGGNFTCLSATPFFLPPQQPGLLTSSLELPHQMICQHPSDNPTDKVCLF